MKSTKIVPRRPKLKPDRLTTVVPNQIVLFKMSGFCEWPAIVKNVEGDIVDIQFFGDNTTHRSKFGNKFHDFKSSHDLILFHLRTQKKPLYKKSVREAEIALDIQEEYSLLKQI